MVVIVEFELRPGAESEFETALKHMQDQVKKYEGYLGEAPCSSIENENTFISLFYWRDRKSIKAWQQDPEHITVQRLSREKIFARSRFASVSLSVSTSGNTRNNTHPITVNNALSRMNRSGNL